MGGNYVVISIACKSGAGGLTNSPTNWRRISAAKGEQPAISAQAFADVGAACIAVSVGADNPSSRRCWSPQRIGDIVLSVIKMVAFQEGGSPRALSVSLSSPSIHC